MLDKKYNRLGIIGRFKPIHLGQAKLLESICESAGHVLIGIGSSNKYNSRNPFTAKESEEMIRRSLCFPNYDIVYVPDFNNGKKWASYIKEQFGNLDGFITGNPYVQELLKSYYQVINSFDLAKSDSCQRLNSSRVRFEIANGGDWKPLVPKEISEYLESNGLIERLKREFGEEILQNPELNFCKTCEEERGRIETK